VRRFSVSNPFSSGYISDAPPYAVPLDNASFAQDVFAPSGVIRQRRGWKATAGGFTPQATASVFTVGVAKTQFAFLDNAVRYVVSENSTTKGLLAVSSDGSAWISMETAGISNYVPRCVYEGELILCHPGGEYPILRYSGDMSGNGATSSLSSSPQYASAGSKIGTSVNLQKGSTNQKGRYYSFEPTSGGGRSHQPVICDRIVDGDSSSFTIENCSANAGGLPGGPGLYQWNRVFGVTWPGVIRYEGFSNVSGTSVTFEDQAGANNSAYHDNVPDNTDLYDCVSIAPEGADHKIASLSGSSSVSFTTRYTTGISGKEISYVLARCPWRDAAVHKESLWGVGTKQYPSTVWVWPPAHPLSIPPGSASPYTVNFNAGYQSSSITGFRGTRDYTLFSFDVPSKYDSTPIEALLSTEGPLLVLKTDSVYAVYGTYDPTLQAGGGGLEVRKVTDWGGCVDLRSAISGESGQFWCGSDGIYAWRNGQVVDLTAGKIQKEWKALMRGYVSGTSSVTCGISNDRYLVVSATGLDTSLTSDAKIGPDSSSPSSRTLVYDIPTESWLGRVTNFSPIHMWTSRFEDGGSQCLGVNTTYDGIVDFTPALSETGQSSAVDGNSTYPRMKLWSSTSIAQAEGVEGETKFCDLIVHSNLYDSSTPTSVIELSVVSGGSIGTPLDTTKVLSSISGDDVDRIDRNKRIVNKSGRLHQIRFDMSTTDGNNKNSEIAELVFSFRDSRRGS
jgi:hypothetical protein